MAGVQGTLGISIEASFSGAPVGSSQAAYRAAVAKLVEFAPGTGALDVADLMYHATPQIAASGTLNLDLAGSLTGPLGALVTAAEVIGLLVIAKATNTNNVIVGGAAANAFNGPLSALGTVTLEPGQAFAVTSRNGWAVVAATGDILKIANSAAGSVVDLEIIVIARSVAG